MCAVWADCGCGRAGTTGSGRIERRRGGSRVCWCGEDGVVACLSSGCPKYVHAYESITVDHEHAAKSLKSANGKSHSIHHRVSRLREHTRLVRTFFLHPHPVHIHPSAKRRKIKKANPGQLAALARSGAEHSIKTKVKSKGKKEKEEKVLRAWGNRPKRGLKSRSSRGGYN
ncbi:hypothetical protein BKA80DRAFT_57285 [Phyllosticta citrichinensis]